MIRPIFSSCFSSCLTVLAAALLLGACASQSLQSDHLAEIKGLPSVHEVQDVPFVRQKVAHCGPATLAMAMNWGLKADGRTDQISVDTLANQVYTPGMKGSFQADMIGASRRNGFLAIPITGFEPLLREVAADHPVIVFENLLVSWYPQWHYAVVHGYDLDKRTLLMHSGPSANETERMRRFEADWKLADYWGLVVLPPDRVSIAAGELANVKAAFALEQLGKLDEAGTAYAAILKQWPGSLAAAVGAANVAFTRKNFKASVDYLKLATDTHPASAAAWHNLAIAQESAKQKKDAKKSALRAIELASPEEKMTFVERLRDVIQ